MPTEIRQLFPARKRATNAARIGRMERLLTTACKLLAESEQAMVIWPKELVNWYEKNVPDKPLTFDQALDELTEEQITALGLWADEDDPDEAA